MRGKCEFGVFSVFFVSVEVDIVLLFRVEYLVRVWLFLEGK